MSDDRRQRHVTGRHDEHREIEQIERQVWSAARTTIKKATRIGKLLTEHKARLGHGRWGQWAGKLPWNVRTTTNYMRVYEERKLIAGVKTAKMRGCAILIVAHRAGALALADNLLVLRDGRLELIGPRDEVTARLNAAAQNGANLAPLRPREVQS